jgi:hypothetical protein
MIRYIIFSNHIDKESVELFLNNFSLIVKEFELVESDYKKLIIYFSSSGGSVQYCNYMVHFINSYVDKFLIEMVIADSVYSCGFTVPFTFNGKVIVTDFTNGLLHKINFDVSVKDFYKSNSIEKFLVKEIDNSAKDELDKYWFLSEKDKKKFLNGDDIYLSNKLLKEIFEKENLKKCA